MCEANLRFILYIFCPLAGICFKRPKPNFFWFKNQAGRGGGDIGARINQ